MCKFGHCYDNKGIMLDNYPVSDPTHICLREKELIPYNFYQAHHLLVKSQPVFSNFRELQV